MFQRDAFTCRYCGKMSDEVQLAVDHIIPVSKGGTNDAENLVTACVPCNQGKSDKLIDPGCVNDSGRLARHQEMQEQIAAAKAARQVSKARAELRQLIVNQYCLAFGVNDLLNRSASCLYNIAQQHGIDLLFDWIEIAASRLRGSKREIDIIKYICGIRRKVLDAEKEASIA